MGGSAHEQPVWPAATGHVRGVAIEPLYETVVAAALADVKLYEILALIDGVRAGRARGRQLAAHMLGERLNVAHGAYGAAMP